MSNNTKKNRDRWAKQSYSILGVYAAYCYDDTQRAILNRIADLPENRETIRLQGLMSMTKQPDETLAERWADIQMAFQKAVMRVTEEVLAEEREREAAEDAAAAGSK